VYLCGTVVVGHWLGVGQEGGGGWSGTPQSVVGLGEREGEHVELVDIGLNWPEELFPDPAQAQLV